MAANPQGAVAILGQLVNDPASRFAPPGYWFYFKQPPNGVTAEAPLRPAPLHQNPASPAEMEAAVPRLEMENRAAINWLRMNQQNPNNPLHQAGILNRLENNPANRQAGIALGVMDVAQAEAAQRDLAIAQELEAIREANQNLEQRLAMDVQFVETTNAGINLCNDRALPVLKAITGKDLGADPEKWNRWWTDQLGYSYQSDMPETKPTYTDFVTDPVPVAHGSCFPAGTLVQTIDGPQPIESIKVGDQVLSQGTTSGQLVFQPVLATHRNQPAATLRITVDGETIVATGIHRFWKAGTG
jgi:hypothetical protein